MKKLQEWLRLYSSLAVFLFFSLSLTLPTGYSYGASLLLLGGLATIISLNYSTFKPKDWLLLAAMLSYTTIHLLGILIHNLSIREFDKPLRIALGGIALFFTIKYPPRSTYFWTGVAFGAIGAGTLALWQVLYEGIPRAGGFTMIIQFGNISLLLGLLSAIGLIWSISNKKNLFTNGIFIAAIVLGLSGSALSGSRGGWIAMPLATIGTIYIFRQKIKPSYISFFTISVLILSSILYLTPKTNVATRFKEAQSDIANYISGDTTTSLGTRFELWRGAFIIFKESPIIGIGEKAYTERLKELIDSGVIKPAIVSHAHNDFLDALAKNGIIGLIAIIFLYVAPLYLFLNSQNSIDINHLCLNAAGCTFCTCYMSFGLSQSFLLHNSGVMVYSFGLAIIWSLSRHIEESKISNHRTPSIS